MSITITKIKTSGDDKYLGYTRPLADGKQEECKLKLVPVPSELVTALLGLLPYSIDMIGLDEERWGTASITGLSLRYPMGKIGFTATLVNKEEGDDSTKVITVNTPAIDHDDYGEETYRILQEIIRQAKAIVESRPIQAELSLEVEVG